MPPWLRAHDRSSLEPVLNEGLACVWQNQVLGVRVMELTGQCGHEVAACFGAVSKRMLRAVGGAQLVGFLFLVEQLIERRMSFCKEGIETPIVFSILGAAFRVWRTAQCFPLQPYDAGDAQVLADACVFVAAELAPEEVRERTSLIFAVVVHWCSWCA